MESWAKMNNSLINVIDEKAVKAEPRHTSLKNTLKTILKSYPSQVLNGNAVYNKKFVIDIPRTRDNLAGLFVKCTLAFAATSTVIESRTPIFLFKRITLRTTNGVVLQTITPIYTNARVDEIVGTPLYSQISAGLIVNSPLTLLTTTVTFPLFLFLSESTNTFLSTRLLEPLQVLFETNDTKESMGISVNELTQFDTVLYSKYYDTYQTDRTNTQPNAVKSGIPKSLYGSYNIFEEDTQTTVTGATSAKLLLRCPFPVFAIHVTILGPSSTTTIIDVTNFKITTNGVELVNLDSRINYELFNNTQARIANGTFTYFFNKLKSRTEDSGLLIFSGPMFPSYLEIEFATTAAGYTITTLCEYRSNYEVSEQGRIRLAMDSNMDQRNSYQGQANLLG